MRVFKCGPDFLDPMIHARASGAPVYQLDLAMVGEAESRRLLWQAAGEADLILIEGVMGLFDGKPSAADLARHFGVPVLGVIDGAAMAQTFGALAHGLATFQPDLPFAGVLGNRVASSRHGDILRDALPPSIRWFGALPRSAAATGSGLPFASSTMREMKYGPKMKVVTTVKKGCAAQSNNIQLQMPFRSVVGACAPGEDEVMGSPYQTA